jgi:hypothetical protein
MQEPTIASTFTPTTPATCRTWFGRRTSGVVGHSSRTALRRCAAIGALLFVADACSPPMVTPERITKIEVRNLKDAEKMLEGQEVRNLLEGAQCKEGDVAWRGGYPATIFLDNGRDIEVDGFSYYERVLRVSRKQYCEFGEKQWKAVFGELLEP